MQRFLGRAAKLGPGSAEKGRVLDSGLQGPHENPLILGKTKRVGCLPLTLLWPILCLVLKRSFCESDRLDLKLDSAP